MQTKVFIAGSLTIKHLDPQVTIRIDKIASKDFEVVVGDADGVDASIQKYLSDHGVKNATVFCSGESPRNNLGNWPVQRVKTHHATGSRAFFTAKDIRMAEVADFGFMIWDTKSTGTLCNVLELLARKKKAVVFVNKEKIFKNISTVEELEDLLSYMSNHARMKAEEKIQLSTRIRDIKHEQVPMFA